LQCLSVRAGDAGLPNTALIPVFYHYPFLPAGHRTTLLLQTTLWTTRGPFLVALITGTSMRPAFFPRWISL
jgi:hypothetical protein